MKNQRPREVEYVAEGIQLERGVLAFEPTTSGQCPGQMPTLSRQYCHTAPCWCIESLKSPIALCKCHKP